MGATRVAQFVGLAVACGRVIVRCTKRLRDVLGVSAGELVDVPAHGTDWYGHVVWIGRRKCLALMHEATLFPVFVADVRAAGLRPFGPVVVDLVHAALRDEGLDRDALGRLDPQAVGLAATASRSMLGFLTQALAEVEDIVYRKGGLDRIDVIDVNRWLRRALRGRDGDYHRPIDLVRERRDPGAVDG